MPENSKLILQENLQPGSLVTLLHTPLGLQGIVNCLDLAQGAVTSTLRLEFLPQSLLWVPSLSQGVSAHRTRALSLGLNHNTIVACANQASAQFSREHAIGGAAGQSFVLAQAGTRIGQEDGREQARLFEVQV